MGQCECYDIRQKTIDTFTTSCSRSYGVCLGTKEAAENLGKSTAWVSILCNADFILRYDR